MPLPIATTTMPTMRTSVPREEKASIHFLTKSPSEPRKVRPSDFQKWVKRFNGTGDPYRHLASFQQMARAKKVHDLHTLVEGFGLTMEGRALTWFQTQKTANFSSFAQLAKDFVREHTKSGLKHDVLSQIHRFKQEPNESVRDCASRLRQY